MASYAHAQQAHWTEDQHSDFWAQLLPHWPHATRPNLAKLHWEVVNHARDVLQLSDREIAGVIGVQPDTLRRQHYVYEADEMDRTSPLGTVSLGTSKWDALETAPRGPFVYRSSEPPPALVDPNRLVPRPDPHPLVAAAESRLRELEKGMWASGELAWDGTIFVRNGDRAGAREGLLRLIGRDLDDPAEADEIIEDGVRRGELPGWLAA